MLRYRELVEFVKNSGTNLLPKFFDTSFVVFSIFVGLTGTYYHVRPTNTEIATEDALYNGYTEVLAAEFQ